MFTRANPSHWNGIVESLSLRSRSFAPSTPLHSTRLRCDGILPRQLRFETGSRSKLSWRSCCSETTRKKDSIRQHIVLFILFGNEAHSHRPDRDVAADNRR